MTEKVLLGRLGSTAATMGVVSYEVMGGITHLRGLSLSPLNELSKSLLFAIIQPLQRKIDGKYDWGFGLGDDLGWVTLYVGGGSKWEVETIQRVYNYLR